VGHTLCRWNSIRRGGGRGGLCHLRHPRRAHICCNVSRGVDLKRLTFPGVGLVFPRADRPIAVDYPGYPIITLHPIEGLKYVKEAVAHWAIRPSSRLTCFGSAGRRERLRQLCRRTWITVPLPWRSEVNHGVEKRTAAHPRRHFKRKTAGSGVPQFCTEVARHGR
jgi:hypothetical protein